MPRHPEDPMPAAVLTPLSPDELVKRDALVREVASIYPYIPGKNGIDFASIISQSQNPDNSNGSMKCTGGSGRSLQIELESRDIKGIVYDLVVVREGVKPELGKRILEAHYNIEKKTLGFNLKTKTKHLRRRHPDFFAGKFIEFAIKYFEQIRGHNIENVKGDWRMSSDNFKAFFMTYDKDGKDRKYFQKDYQVAIDAAKSTWTGRILSNLGFTEIDDVDLRLYEEGAITIDGYQFYSRVEAIFSRKECL